MKRQLGAFIIGLCLISTFGADGEDSFWDRVVLQKTFDKTVVPDAASFSFLSPAGSGNTYAIASALRVNVVPKTLEQFLEFGPFVEYNRNTDLKTEQNSLTAGLSFDWTTGDLSASPWVGLVTGKVNYARQPIKAADSFQASLLITGVPQARGDRPGAYWLPNIRRTLGPIYASFGPYSGLEYERVYSAASPGQEGSVLRLVARIQLALQGKKAGPFEKFEVLTAYEYRRDIHDTTADIGRDHPLFVATLTYYLLKPAAADDIKNVGISIGYTNGADPAKGLVKQEFTQLSLRIRL
jgi:hypothetical protein